jgi:DNA-binding CsgD family transcriptional regulator
VAGPAWAGRKKDSPLTAREHQVAQLVADGLTNPQIAARLGVSPRTVVNHLEHIRAKLDLRTRTQVATWITRRYPRSGTANQPETSSDGGTPSDSEKPSDSGTSSDSGAPSA